MQHSKHFISRPVDPISYKEQLKMFTIKGTRETLTAADSHSFTQVLLEVWREKQSQGTGLPILDIERLVIKCNTPVSRRFIQHALLGVSQVNYEVFTELVARGMTALLQSSAVK